MSFKANLSIEGGSEIRLTHCSYSLHRDVDATGRPSSAVKGGTVQFEIESTHDTSLNEWMIDQFTHKNGNVIFLKRDSNTKMKELKFENAYIVHISETFDSIGENPCKINFTITAEKITVGNATHTNPWPKES
ncbi:MAG: type VI secretion system tube protein TssD [Bacteroidota bacterium]